MTASMAGFAFNDGMMKMAMQTLPLLPAILLRGLLMCALLAAICLATGAFRARTTRRDRRLIAQRSAAELGGTLCFLTALNNMPIASATAILQSLPLAVTLAAALFLGEPVGWRRGLALVVGFAGVLLIVRPGADSFDLYALLALAAVGFMLVRDLTTRGLSPDLPSSLVSLATAATLSVAAAVGSLFVDWPPVTAGTLGWIVAAALFLIVGYMAGVATMRVGEIGFISPFRYSILVFAGLTGIALFDEIPDALSLAGAALIVGSGLFTFWREQRVAARFRAGAQPPART
ncbi:EamA family transporter [Rhodobacteraceae bacterium 2CG4]|uniref:EamA family transporter n=2 Tax=Halovulum marinum TaxID=2662447 RepID=A0A6L5YVB9_9RHOB|nr:EamA family transporter [Halovulum marinum]